MALTRTVTINGANAVIHTPRWNGTGAGLRGVICQHGHGSTAIAQLPQGGIFAGHPEQLADKGYVVAGIDTGDTWDAAAAMTALTNLYGYLLNTVGIAGIKVAGLGWSMGGGHILRWILENPTLVNSAFLFSPVSDLDWAEQQVAWTAQIDALYGGSHATYLTTGSPRSPLNNAAAFRNGPAVRIAHATDDPTVPYTQSTGFVTAVSNASVSLRTPDITGGHQGALLNVPPREVWEWIRTRWT